MRNSLPLYANEQSAAKLFDVSVSQFRTLVQKGHLPPGRAIAPGLTRWNVTEIVSIVEGRAADGGDIQW